MEFSTKSVTIQPEIRKRVTDGDILTEVTLDFSAVTATADDGEKIVKAGTPINATTGVLDNTATASGILLTDVVASRPIGTILRHGMVNTAVAQSNSGVTIAAECKTALSLIIFE